MKKWSFLINKKPKQIIEELESLIEQNNAFVLNIEKSEPEFCSFHLRKRIQFGEQILHRNLIKVVGKISSTERDNSSKVEILFKQNTLVILTKTILFGLALVSLIVGLISNISFIIPGIILFGIGIILWLSMDKKFDENSEQYKRLITELFVIE